jgi:twinkle protein
MISEAMFGQLEARGLDGELASARGFASIARDGGEALVIPFVRDGKIVRRKYRMFDREEGRWSQDKGGLRIAWNEDVLREESLIGQPLLITEGELDALAAIQCGFARTISVPDGAPPPGDRSAGDLESGTKYAWLKDIKPFLAKDRCPEIVIAADGDENGAALLHDLSLLLGRFRCKYLAYPLAKSPEKRGRERLKDLNEVLEDYGSKGVVETVARAQWLRVDGVYRMHELPPLPPQVIYEPPFALFSENFKVRLGDFAVITGTPGFGKTAFANDLYCRTAAANDLTIAWASFEQEPQGDHKRNLRTWFCGRPAFELSHEERVEADAWIDSRHVFLVPSEDEDATLEWLFDRMEVAVVRFGARIIVIDPWNELEHSRREGESETEYIGRAIRGLKRFAKAFRVHIAVVAHPTKSVKDADGKYKMPTLYDISGSANWYNKADLGVIVHRESELDTLIKVQKSRYHEVIGRPGEVLMQFCRDDRRFHETERAA